MAIGPEHSLPFGCYEPSALQSTLIAIGRRLPRNWAGRRIASVIRSVLKRYSGRPSTSFGSVVECAFTPGATPAKNA
jgi:hypothetical protein